MLTQLFQQIEQSKSAAATAAEPSVIYFGDHLHTDCMATRQFTPWAAGAVVEEIEQWHAQPLPGAADASAATVASQTCAGAGAGHKCKHETFSSLEQLISAEEAEAKAHGSSAFGCFFHHHRRNSLGAGAAPTAPVAAVPEWTYWHHVLQQHCDVVVGCLTDCIPLAAGENVALSPPSAASGASPAAALATTFPGYVGPRLNASCVHPPTLVRFQPPPFGSAYGGANTPAKRDADAAAAAASSASASSSDATSATAAAPRPAVTSLQYSVHRVPLSMKQELRPIFPELAAPSSAPMTLAEFKALPILAVATFQPAARPMVSFCADVEREKNRLLECFDAWARRVCLRLRAGEQATGGAAPVWADLVDPSSGYPSLGPHGSSVYSEVDSAQILLAYRMDQVGNCSVIDHPQWHLAHFPATLLTTAPLERVLQVIAQVQEELKPDEE
jgi:hypothetical protein